MGSLLWLPKTAKNTGLLGYAIQPSGEWTLSSHPSINSMPSSLSPVLLQGSGKAIMAEAFKSRSQLSLQCYQPSPRPSNWLKTLSLQRSGNKYVLPIKQLIKGLKWKDPPAILQLALLVAVPEECCRKGLSSSLHCCSQATGDLILIVFYYLLRCGEYTAPRFVKHRDGTLQRATLTKREEETMIYEGLTQLPRQLLSSTFLLVMPDHENCIHLCPTRGQETEKKLSMSSCLCHWFQVRCPLA